MKYKIAIDIMGGDNAPDMVIKGIISLLSNLKDKKDLFFYLFGISGYNKLITKEISEYCEFVECENKIDPDTKPSYAVKYMRNSTMASAIKYVKDGKADVCLSAGNTGALMALSKILIRPIQGIDKLPLCTIIPTAKNNSIMLDLGAVTDCKPINLFQFAMMGVAFISAVFPEIKKPTIGILNIGSEAGKGNSLIQETQNLILSSDLKDNFYGFIEGDDIPLGKVNIIVTDGFTGNVALKTYEGCGKVIKSSLTEVFNTSILTKIGYLLCKSSLKNVMQKMNHNNYNGALLLGLEGLVVKSHGSATAEGFSNSIEVALNLAKNNINQKIRDFLLSSNAISLNADTNSKDLF